MPKYVSKTTEYLDMTLENCENVIYFYGYKISPVPVARVAQSPVLLPSYIPPPHQADNAATSLYNNYT